MLNLTKDCVLYAYDNLLHNICSCKHKIVSIILYVCYITNISTMQDPTMLSFYYRSTKCNDHS